MGVLYRRRAYLDEPRVFRQYAPIAEKIMHLAEQSGVLNRKQLSLLRARVQGMSFTTIDPVRGRTGVLQRQERTILSRLSRIDGPLVSRFNELRKVKLSKKAIEERIAAYRSSPAYVAATAKRRRRWYEKHKTEIRAAAQRPSAKRRMRKYKKGLYWSNPAIRRKAIERAREYHIQHRGECLKKKREYSQRPEVQKHIQKYMKRYKGRWKELAGRRKEYKQFKQMLRSGEPHVREAAAISIGARKYRIAFDQLRALLNDENEFDYVRIAVVWTFGENRDWRAVPDLIRLAAKADSDRDESMLVEIIKALGKIGTRDAKEAIRRYSLHPSDLVQAAVRKAAENTERQGRFNRRNRHNI